jgi:SAM-dependent methyltransferase
MKTSTTRPDYGIDAPHILRNLFLFGIPLFILGFVAPHTVRLGPMTLGLRPMCFWTGLALIVEGFLYLGYVKLGKLKHRDVMLALHPWRGDEQVLDVGCGRGLLLAGAAHRLAALGGSGRATGIDIWSNVDMGGNSEAATRRNLELEGVSDRCTLLSVAAQQMPFADGAFDVVVSNLCIHNIYDRPTRLVALREIVRVLRPGGVAILSDYKLTGEYAAELRRAGLAAASRWGNPLYTFPPLRIVVARKPAIEASAAEHGSGADQLKAG